MDQTPRNDQILYVYPLIPDFRLFGRKHDAAWARVCCQAQVSTHAIQNRVPFTIGDLGTLKDALRLPVRTAPSALSALNAPTDRAGLELLLLGPNMSASIACTLAFASSYVLRSAMFDS